MDITFFGIDVKHVVEAQIASLSKECTALQRRRQDLEPLSTSRTIGYGHDSSMWDHPDLEYFGGRCTSKVDSETKRLREEEMKLLKELEQADAHCLLAYRMLRIRPIITALRRVLRRRGKSTLSRLPADTIRDIGQCLDLTTRISMCRFLYEMCLAR